MSKLMEYLKAKFRTMLDDSSTAEKVSSASASTVRALSLNLDEHEKEAHSKRSKHGGEGKLGYISPQKKTIWGLYDRLGARTGADLGRMLRDMNSDDIQDAAESTRDGDDPLPMVVEGIDTVGEVLALRDRTTGELKEVPFRTAVRYANER